MASLQTGVYSNFDLLTDRKDGFFFFIFIFIFNRFCGLGVGFVAVVCLSGFLFCFGMYWFVVREGFHLCLFL